MGTMFRLNSSSFTPAAGTKVIKAAEYGVMTEANALLEDARARAEKTLKDAETAYQEKREEGYRDGLEEGKMEHSEKMLETILSSVEFIEGIEGKLVQIVNQAVRKIIGDMDSNERIVAIVRNALNTVRNQQNVIVRVAPADEPAVTQALAVMTASSVGSSSFLTILADARLPRDSCILESELGVIDASLETQIKALEQAFKAKIQQ